MYCTACMLPLQRVLVHCPFKIKVWRWHKRCKMSPLWCLQAKYIHSYINNKCAFSVEQNHFIESDYHRYDDTSSEIFMCQGTDKGTLQKQGAMTFVAKEKLVAKKRSDQQMKHGGDWWSFLHCRAVACFSQVQNYETESRAASMWLSQPQGVITAFANNA